MIITQLLDIATNNDLPQMFGKKFVYNFIINEVRYKLDSVSHKVTLKTYKQTLRIVLEMVLLLNTVFVKMTMDV